MSPPVERRAVWALILLALSAGPAGARSATVTNPLPAVTLLADATVKDAAVPDAAARRLDYMDPVVQQTVTYAPGVELTGSPGAMRWRLVPGNKAGQAGSVLWRMTAQIKETEPLWCWREPDVFVPSVLVRPFYCYIDRDRDGQFDTAYMFLSYGYRSRLFDVDRMVPMKVKPFGYRPVERPGAPDEKLTLRYAGPVKGVIGDDGFMTEGTVQFEARVGATIEQEVVLHVITVTIINGRGRFQAAPGYVVEVEKVSADGHALVKALAGPPPGPLNLFQLAPPKP